MELVNLNKKSNGVWVCEINRPEKLNALSAQLIKELTQVFQDAAQAANKFECRAFLLKSSSPKAFCVGADLAERKGLDDAGVVEALDSLRKLTQSLENIPCPTLALVEGAAFGGGLELALCCDLRAASDKATMGLTETRLAIIPGAGGTQRLTRLIGPAKSKELIFSGKRLSAAEALSFGLLNTLSSEAEKWANEYLDGVVEGGPVALLAAKEAVNNGLNKSISEALDVERTAYLRTLKTEDRHEGLKAFAEKRKPQYKGC